MNGIRSVFIAVALLLLVAEPSAGLNITPPVDVDDLEIWLCLDRHAFEFDGGDWALFMIRDAIGEPSFEAGAGEAADDTSDWEISLTRVWERP